MNYTDESTPYTRVTEHKYFTPWEKHEKTVVYHEYSRECLANDLPYYPIRLVGEQAVLREYVDMAENEAGVSFIGRLATYRYLDMDVTIAEALQAARKYVSCAQSDRLMPAFCIAPL